MDLVEMLNLVYGRLFVNTFGAELLDSPFALNLEIQRFCRVENHSDSRNDVGLKRDTEPNDKHVGCYLGLVMRLDLSITDCAHSHDCPIARSYVAFKTRPIL